MTGQAITVAVAACGRPAGVERCLAALASGTVRPREVIVVDQDPSPTARRVVEGCGIAGVRYLEQPRLGLSASRNLALAEATGSMIAVTDDDCVPDAGWIEAILAANEREPTPAAVTGPVLALGSQPPGTYAISLRPSLVPIDYRGRLLPWKAGSGANFAASCDLLRHFQGWDIRLGTGSGGKAAEDADLIYRLLRAGAVIRYEPAAVVRHDWQTWERRLATRRSYAHGVGALAGLWLMRGDRFAGRMLTTFAADHIRALAVALREGDHGKISERLNGIAGLAEGFIYGLRTRPARVTDGPRPPAATL